MSTPLYVFTAHQVNIANLVQYHIVNYTPEKFYKNCTYYNDGKFLFSDAGDAVKEIALVTDNTPIRRTDWSPHIELLTEYIEQATKHNQYMLFANHNLEQITLLKQHFGSAMKVVCINYDQNLYPYLLKNMAQYHVYLLTHNKIHTTETDSLVLKNLSTAVEYYSEAFDQMNMIPKSSISTGDYNIYIDDFFNHKLMTEHFDNLGFPVDNARPGLYHSWLNVITQDQDFPN